MHGNGSICTFRVERKDGLTPATVPAQLSVDIAKEPMAAPKGR